MQSKLRTVRTPEVSPCDGRAVAWLIIPGMTIRNPARPPRTLVTATAH